ncbi:MAG: UDP-N-acetylmuramate dehydrogenase [Ilumatobacteraceae bacterium]|nr:UDP-N-acetylmuramate dehydrogenase [Ilumatobacteraceae bacterium]
MDADDTDSYARETRALDRLGILLGARVQRDVKLAAYTTYKVGGPASLLVKARSIDDLHAVSNALREKRVPLLVIGRGSNLLVADEGFAGLVVVLGEFAEQIIWPEQPAVPRVVAGGAVALPVLARQSAARGLTGFEWGVGVPGSVGGGVRMNAGGHGSDMAASLESIKIFHLLKGIVANVAAKDVGLRFRGSDLEPYHVVISASFALSWGDQQASEAEMAEIVRWRRERQPGGHNAGSVFVNPAPDGGSAGALIDGLGLRGLRIGTAEVSDKHANFIQVDPGGSADDVAELMALVRARVLSETGVDLHSEVRLVGFDPEVASNAGAQVGGTSNNAPNDSSGGTRLDALFGPLVSDDNTLSAVVISPPLPDEAVVELSELFADTGAITRPDDTPSVADTSQTPAGEVVDISTAIQARELQQAAAGEPVVIDDAQHLLPHERSEASTGVSGAVSTFANTAALGDVIVDDRIGRRTWWKRVPRLRVSPLVGFGVLIAVFSLTLVILASPLFAVRQIDVTGVTYSDPALLSNVGDSLRGASVFTADLEGAQRRLEGDPWVRQARLNWYLPNRVVIEIEERRAVAWFVGVDNRARVLDIDGRVLEVLDGQPTQFMKIEGVGPNLPPGTVTTLVYQAAAQLANSLPADLLPQVRHVFVDGPEALGITLKKGTIITLGAPVDVRNKLTQVMVLLTQQDVSFIAAIDVSSGQPVIANE